MSTRLIEVTTQSSKVCFVPHPLDSDKHKRISEMGIKVIDVKQKAAFLADRYNSHFEEVEINLEQI